MQRQSWNEKLWYYANFTVIWSINEEKLDASICMAHKTTQIHFMHITKRIIYNEMTEKITIMSHVKLIASIYFHSIGNIEYVDWVKNINFCSYDKYISNDSRNLSHKNCVYAHIIVILLMALLSMLHTHINNFK